MSARNIVDWARIEPRRDTDIAAIVYREDRTRVGALISDLSYQECQLTSTEKFAVGERITIVVLARGAEIEAEVKWSADGKSGASFPEA